MGAFSTLLDNKNRNDFSVLYLFNSFFSHSYVSDGHLNNIHWIPQFDLCHPCHVNFDFIGDLATLTEDAEYVLNKISNNTDTLKEFPSQDTGPVSSRKTQQLKQVYSAIPESIRTKLNAVYEKDIAVFGYNTLALLPRNKEQGQRKL